MGKSKKQVLAVVLIIALLFGTLQGFPASTTASFAVDETYLGNLVRQWMDDDGFTYDQTKTKLQNYLGLTLYNGKINTTKTIANVNIIYHFDKLVYTKTEDNNASYFGFEDYQFTDDGTDSKGEYRYLGYTQNGIKVTNSRYPNLAGTTKFIETYADKKYYMPAEASSSWQNVENLQPLDKYMLTKAPIAIDNSKDYFNLKVYDVYNDSGYVTADIENALDDLKNYTIFQNVSTLRLQGAVRTVYRNATGTKDYYRTLNTAPIPFEEPTIKFEVDSSDLTDKKIVFGTTEETKTITVHATIEFPNFVKNNRLEGWVLSNYIEKARISILDKDETATPNDVTNTITKSFDIELNRTDYVSDDTTFNFIGSATVFAQNYFKDQFKPEASLSVPVVVNMGPVEPAFKILYKGKDYTDSEIVFTDWQSFNLSLVPNNQILSNNEIKNVVWMFHANTVNEIKTGNSTVGYVMNESKKATHLTGDTAKFTMTVNMKYPFDYGEQKNITSLTIEHTVDFVQSDIPTAIPNSPPVAKVKAKSRVRLGDEFNFSAGQSYDPDGTIEDYHFSGSYFKTVSMKNESQGRGLFTKGTGEKPIRGRVTDNDGLTDTDEYDIEVIEAVEAKFVTDGQRKENRLVWFDASISEDSKYYPINDSGVTWSFAPLEGQSAASIVYKTNTTGQRIGVLFKESGAYQVTLNVSADCTYSGVTNTESDSISYPITIQPDLPPVAGTAPMTLAIRNPSDNNFASIYVADTSYSPDGDALTRQMYYKYDSDNDGSYTDETGVSLGSGQIIELLRSDDLGRYLFYSEIKEIIPASQTIASALTTSDYLSDSSLDYTDTSQVCLVDNVAPIISATASLDKEIDVVYVTDETGENITKLLTEMDRLNKELYERKIKLNTEYININATGINLLSAGLKKIQTFTWNRWWHVLLNWKWYEYYHEGVYSYLINPSKDYSKILESRTGTIEDMIDFPTYPDAYVTPTRVDVSWDSDGDGYDVDRIYGDIYNAPNDYLKSDSIYYQYGSSIASRSQSDTYWMYHNRDTRLDGANVGRLNTSGISFYPESWSGYTTDWIPGTLVSETDGEYKVLNIESYLSKYADSDNDKYLVFAIANGENFFMTDDTKQNLMDTYGFENVYFSVNDFWGEFKPTAPDAVDVRFPDTGGLYALTEYGNEIYNYSTATDVYYTQNSNAEISDYSVDLIEKGFTKIGANKGYLVSYTSTFGMSPQYSDSWYGAYTYGESKPIDLDATFFYGLKTKSIRLDQGFLIKPATDDWLMADGTVLDVKTYYIDNSNINRLGAIVETNDGKFYYVSQTFEFSSMYGNNISFLDNTFKATELDISGIDEVYVREISQASYFRDGHTAKDNGSDFYLDLGVGVYEVPQDVFVVKDSSGKYILCKNDLNFTTSDYREYVYYTSKGTRRTIDTWFFGIKQKHLVLPFDGLDKFTLSSVSISGSNMPEGTGTVYEYQKFTNKHGPLQWTNLMQAWNLYRYTSLAYEFSTYSLVDTDGNLYIDDVLRATGVSGADVNHDAVAYVQNGKVYGKGLSNTGSMGKQGTKTVIGALFNTPYILNATYSTKAFSSIYDFTSENPAYGLTARGTYVPIMDSILEKYADYSTNEMVLIQVGDSVDIGGYVLDFEGDPIKDMRIDAEIVTGYFDNTNSNITLPNDFTQPVQINSAGKIIIAPRVQNKTIFEEFDYWNEDNTTLTVIAHRPPIAVQKIAIVPQGDGTFNFVSGDGGSYDLDHSVSRADKGIVDKKYYYRKELQATWTEYSGTMALENGVAYQFALAVQDLEGAWSDYDIVDVEINGSPFILTAGVDPPYPTGVPAGSTITITADVFTYKSMASVIANVDGTNVTLSKVGQDGMNSTYSASYTVPSTKADKDYYDIAVTATANDGAVRTSLHKLNVNTPINLTGDIAPYSLKKGQVGTLTAQTSKYATQCYVDLFDGTAGQGRVWLNRTSVSGDLATWSKSYTFASNMPEGVYNAVFVASTANGNSESVTDTFAFIPNQPPLVTIESVQPSFIYEGDDVTLNCQVQDPDLDTLSIVVEMSQDGGVTWTVHSRMEDFPVTHLSGQAFQIRFENVTQTAYLVRVTATDPLGEQGQSTATFSAEALSVVGAVHHTEKWNENRMLFNRAKTGSDDAPRPYNTFWPGEKLVLEGQTTQIDSAATTFCTQVRVHIEGKSGVSSLLSEKNASLYTGEMWTEEMLDWKAQTLHIVFEAAFSNGIVKSHTVEIRIDNSESYWQHHKLF